MKKVLATHFVFAAALFIFFSIYRRWLSLSFVPFWWGAVIGTLLPYVDYLIYIYLLKPKEQISKDVTALISQKKILDAFDKLLASFSQRKDLLVHNASFQSLFLVFSIWMVTSGNLLGMGIVLAFMLHLILDQIMDMVERGNIDNWFADFPVNLDFKQKRWYLAGNIVILFYLGFFF